MNAYGPRVFSHDTDISLASKTIRQATLRELPVSVPPSATSCVLEAKRYPISGIPSAAAPARPVGQGGLRSERVHDVLERLRSPEPPCAVFVYAHPDDEMIAVGGQLSRFHADIFVQVTDGAPSDNADGERLGLTVDEYRSTRALEVRSAFAAAGLPEARHRCLNLPDKEAALHLVSLTEEIAEILTREQPDVVFTHPYEAGHADHDACAFAVHQAVANLSQPRPVILESPFYFRNPADGSMQTGSFLQEDAGSILSIPLSAEQRDLKQAAFIAFATQRDVLANFASVLVQERFRVAPRYDFTRLIAAGPAYYESFLPGMTAVRFTELAAEALQLLRPSTAPTESASPLKAPSILAA